MMTEYTHTNQIIQQSDLVPITNLLRYEKYGTSKGPAVDQTLT